MSPSHPETTNGQPHASIRDHRQAPRGVLPRHVQMWLMAGLAVVIVFIILITGHTPPTPRASVGSTTAPTPVTADRIRSYQRQLADEQARQEQLDRQQRTDEARATTHQ